MKLFKKADEIMNELGYTLIEENKFGASYTRVELSYVHQVDIIRLKEGPGMYSVFSYERGFNSDLFNNSVKLTNLEIKALQKKYRELCHKYGKL